MPRPPGRLLDVRVATLPTVEGESVTMRLLDKSRTPPTLEELGLTEAMRAEFHDIVAKPTGALFVTGPTGSGKSTSLYAALAELNRPEINVITVEDPVEYRLAGIEQVQINQRAGLTFSTALRSILRSDPDVVMIGEIRDVETAKISIEAALTGHFVLSTMHTNDAPGTITRLNEMGVEPFLTASAISAVLAQRLARKLCTSCMEEYQPGDADLRAARVPQEQLEEYMQSDVPARCRLPTLLEHRLPRPRRHLPAAADERRARVAGRLRGEPRRPGAGRVRSRHAAALGGRPRQGSRGRRPRSKSSHASSSERRIIATAATAPLARSPDVG